MERKSQAGDQLADELARRAARAAEVEASDQAPGPAEDVPEDERDFTFMSALLDKSGALMVFLDPRGRIRGFSRGCEEATGYTFDDVWGRYVWDLLMIPEEVESLRDVFRRLRDGERSIEYESHWLTRDGRRRLIAWSSTALFDAEGSLEYVIATGIDITSRSGAQQALGASEERYRRLVESSPDAVLVHYQGNILFANRAAVALLGASTPEQVIGKPVMDFVHPDDRAAVTERLDKILEQGTELPLIQDKLIRLDQTEVQVEADSIFPFMYEGKPGVQVVAREVVDRGRRQEAPQGAGDQLQEAEDWHRQLLETNVAGTYHAGLGGRLLVCNEAFAEMLGYESCEEVVGLHASELFLDPAGWDGFVVELQERGSLTNAELHLRCKDGSPLLVRQNASLVPSEDDETVVVQATLIEMPDRPQMDGALWDARQMYGALVKISTDAVVATDLRGRITDLSNRALELYGFESVEELIGRSAFELVAPEDHEKAIVSLQKTLKEGVLRNADCTLVRKDGTRLVVRQDMALIRDVRGRPQAFVFAARDLGERQVRRAAVEPAIEVFRDRGTEYAREVAEPSGFENTAAAIFNSCKRLIGATGGYVALLGADGARHEVVLSDPEGLARELYRLEHGLIRRLQGEVYGTGRPVIRNDVSGGEATESMPEGRLALDNLVLAPLVIDGNVVGSLAFANKPGGFTEHDARTASAFGELAAIALHSDRTMEALEASEARFRSVSQIADHAIITVDNRESIVSWNRGAEVIFGYSANEATGRRLTLAVPDELRKAYQKAMSQVALEGGFAIVAEAAEMVGRRKDGNEFPLELSLVAWKTSEGIFLTSSIRDITHRRLAEDAVRQLADHDPLTGLANRALFSDHLTLALANAHRNRQKLAVIMLDLDRFMEINHTLGHSVGDELLRSVGDRLSSLVRTGDTVARLGGDEFMLLLPGIAQREHGIKIAEKVLEALQRPFLLNSRELNITASIGVALYPDHGEDVEILVRNADLAMCRAKEDGGNSIECSDPTRDARDGDGMVLVT